MSIALNNISTADDYTEANTRRQPNTVRVNLIVGAKSGVTGSGSCYLQLADPDDPAGTNYANDAVFYPPGRYSLDRRCSGARVKSGAVGVASMVTLELLTAKDIGA